MTAASPRPSTARWRRETPPWLVSLIVHAVLLMVLAGVTWRVHEPVEREFVIDLRADDAEAFSPVDGDAPDGGGALGRDADAADAQAGAAPIPEAPPVPDATDTPAPSIAAAAQASERNDAARPVDPALALLEGAGSDAPAGGRARPGAGDGLADRIGGMRRAGLDVVFVLDATGNMGPFIAQAQQRMERIADVLIGMIEPEDADARGRGPGVRFGIVAFKDYGDEYGLNATIHQPLTDDRAALRNFLDQIIVGGGGDQTEPIHEALHVASDAGRMGWRRNSEAVIVLVTEAAVHLTGREAAYEAAARFRRVRSGRIHVIDVGAIGRDGRQRVNVLQDLQEIAQRGGGQAFLLMEEEGFWRELIISVFGRRHAADVEAILRRYTEP